MSLTAASAADGLSEDKSDGGALDGVTGRCCSAHCLRSSSCLFVMSCAALESINATRTHIVKLVAIVLDSESGIVV